MGTALLSVAPHLAAAAWNAISRCSPSVVPVLPPTGAAGVPSLKPTPAALPLTMTMVAAALAALAASRPDRATAARAKDLFLIAVYSRRSDDRLQRCLFVRLVLDAAVFHRTIRLDVCDRV